MAIGWKYNTFEYQIHNLKRNILIEKVHMKINDSIKIQSLI